MALVMAAILYACGRNYKIITLFLYFASMEALQFLQYGVIDQVHGRACEVLHWRGATLRDGTRVDRH